MQDKIRIKLKRKKNKINKMLRKLILHQILLMECIQNKLKKNKEIHTKLNLN